LCDLDFIIYEKKPNIFLCGEDIRPIVELIERDFDLNYFVARSPDSEAIPKLDSLLDTKGVVNYGDWNLNNDYLIIEKGKPLNIRSVEQRKGGVRYFVDQKENPDSIIFKPSGIFKEKILVGGFVGTISDTEFSLKLYKAFSMLIKKNFKKRIGNFYVGEKALMNLHQGWRLVTDDKSPIEYDLKVH